MAKLTEEQKKQVIQARDEGVDLILGKRDCRGERTGGIVGKVEEHIKEKGVGTVIAEAILGGIFLFLFGGKKE